MRKITLAAAILIILGLVIGFFPTHTEKPVKDGLGPMAIRIDPQYPAPEYHNPLDWWQTHHMDVVNRGDLMQADCLHCHEPQTSCNNCHSYVGVQEVALPAAGQPVQLPLQAVPR
ncbi:MAG: hypothetical protein KJ077_32590 [Anaerolineae bacterium]|nr:hypothetical protein [Anaerolineae bacterium]